MKQFVMVVLAGFVFGIVLGAITCACTPEQVVCDGCGTELSVEHATAISGANSVAYYCHDCMVNKAWMN